MPNLAISQDDHHMIRLAAAKRGTKISEIAHNIILAGLKEVAPEVLLPAYNANSNITPEAFQALFISEKDAISRPLLRRNK